MSYFQKKHTKNSFSNCEDSFNGQDNLSVNSNIFNKIANTNTRDSHNKSNLKDNSPISYLKNFKKSYCKINQENINYVEPAKNKKQNNPKGRDIQTFNEVMKSRESFQQKISDKSGGKPQQQHQPNMKKKPIVNSHLQSFQEGSFHQFMHETSQSMQQMLNSSINQFERFLQQQNDNAHNIYEQNITLKKTLTKFKSILKQKLQSGLNKQKQEIKNMLSEYVQLITKLLKDKEELSTQMQRIEQDSASKFAQIDKLKFKLEDVTKQKDEHIQKTKLQIDDFLMIIEQFEDQAKNQNDKIEIMEKQIKKLKQIEEQYQQLLKKNINNVNSKNYASEYEEQEKRIENQSQKIQTLLQLLQKSQQQTNTLKQILSKQSTHQGTSNFSQETYHYQLEQIKGFYEQKLQQLEIQHEEEFIEYEKAIKQTITKKDECIERLNLIIQESRNKNSGSQINNSGAKNQRDKNSTNIRNSENIRLQSQAMFEQ